ncbi:hypothetical protein FKM82_005679 [Ascaphus truei]
MSSLQDALLTPEENTYKFTPCRTGCGIPMLLPMKGSGSVRPYDPSLSQYEAKLDSFGSITSSWGSPRTFQGGQNVPVESDDSVPDSCLSAISQELRDLSILRPGSQQGGSTSPGAALQCQNQMPGAQGQLPPQHSLLGQSSLAGDGNSASADSQVMFVPRHQIVINPAKQKFVEQLALYDQGQITSLELLSSGTSPGIQLPAGFLSLTPSRGPLPTSSCSRRHPCPQTFTLLFKPGLFYLVFIPEALLKKQELLMPLLNLPLYSSLVSSTPEISACDVCFLG